MGCLGHLLLTMCCPFCNVLRLSCLLHLQALQHLLRPFILDSRLLLRNPPVLLSSLPLLLRLMVLLLTSPLQESISSIGLATAFPRRRLPP